MGIYQYSEWDGSQNLFDIDADELMDELGRNMMSYGDISQALRLMQRAGMRDSQGKHLPGLQELIQKLRQRKQSQLDKYKLNSIVDDIRKKLDNILKTEREGIEKQLEEAKKGAGGTASDLSPEMRDKLLKKVQNRAAQNLKKLDELPRDVGGRIKELTKYDFMDRDAQQQFQELMEMLKKHAMESYTRDLTEKLKSMDARSLANMRHMLEALNQMLEQRLKGEQPDFESFMQQFGEYFGPNPPKDLDELMQRLQEQIAQAQSLLNSMSPEERQSLQELLQSMLDEGTQYEMAKLAANLQALLPNDSMKGQYLFTGEEPISYTEALKLMEMLQKIDKLEGQLRDSQYDRSLDDIDEDLLKEVLGDEAAQSLEQLRDITKMLENAGYIRMKDGKYELTPQGMRKIGQRALEDIFAQLRKDRTGSHDLRRKGYGGERLEETRKFEVGDDFNIHLQKSIMNSIYRKPGPPPVSLNIEDFEVYETEEQTRSATVLMLDMSLSMPMRGNFQAAKRVAIALDGLIRTQYPRDTLYMVGFSSYARRVNKEEITYMSWDEFDPYTNIQHGLLLSRKILAKEQCSNKQIILISDGEPTAHFEGKDIFFQYPPSVRTLQLTLQEVRNCTMKGIVINTFMLESGRFLSNFVSDMARINKGRVFYTDAENLGQYLLVDYISNKKRRLH